MASVADREDLDTGEPVSLTVPAIRFSSSIFFGLLAGLILQIFTLAFLGRLGDDALYVRAMYTPIGFLVLAITQGVTVAAQVSAGIAMRSGRQDTLRPLPTFLALGAGLLALLAGLFAVTSGLVMDALHVHTDQRQELLTFVVAVCLTTIIGLVPQVGGAMLRGMGRTSASSALSIGFTALSMAAMTALGVSTRLGVLAVPASTVIAGVVVGGASLPLFRGQRSGRPWFRRDAAAEFWVFGAPVAATFLLLSSVNFGFLRVLRNAGRVDVAGFNLGQGANAFFMAVAFAVGSGAAVAANLQPGRDRRAIEAAGLSAAVRVSLPPYAVIGVLAWALRGPLSRLLTSDAEVAQTTAHYFAWMGPTFVVFGGTLAVLTYLEEVGRGRTALLLNVVYFAVLLLIAFQLPQPVDSNSLTKLLAVFNVIGFGTCWLTARFLISRLR